MDLDNGRQHIYLSVSPLQILVDDPRVDILCQGLVMDIITDLSRFRPFQVISPDIASGTSSGESGVLDVPDVDYMVKGMVRYQKEEIQINIQLLHAGDGRLVWAEKMRGKLEDLFRIEEDIVEKIVVSLQRFVDYDLLLEIRKKPITSLGAYECWLRGFQELKKSTLEADEQAREYFQQALEIDAEYARACTGMSLSYFNEWSCQLWSRWDVSKNSAFEWAKRALQIDEWDHVSNVIIGRIYLFNGEYDKAEHYLRKALRINPNDAEMLILIAFGFVYLGYVDEALGLHTRARRLNPNEIFMAHACGAFVQFERGALKESIQLGDQHDLGTGWVDFPAFQAAAYYLTGDLDAMWRYWQFFLDDFSKKINGGKPADPKTAVQWMKDVNPYRDKTRLEPFWQYMLSTLAEENGAHDSELPAPQSENTTTMVQAGGNILACKGELWLMQFNGKVIHLPDIKGLHDLSRLLSQPYEPVHCTDLMGAESVEPGAEVFDEKARASYKERILVLQEELAAADERSDTAQLEILQEEYDKILDHLGKAIGKGGTIRKQGGTIEKCRAAVTWRIRSAIKKIEQAHPPLGRHLNLSVKTGVFCSYSPEVEMNWKTGTD